MSRSHAPRPVLVPAMVSILGAALTAQTDPYRVVDLGVVPGQAPQAGVVAEGMSNDGSTICGFSVFLPYVWDRTFGMRALQNLPGTPNGWPIDVNSAGVAVGVCGLTTTTAVVWNVLGEPLALPPLGSGVSGPYSSALEINDLGQVVGVTSVAGGARHLFSWTQAAGMVDLTPTAQDAWVYDLNDAGQTCVVIDGQAFRSTPGQPLLPLGNFVAECINEFGQMAGKQNNETDLWRYTDGIGWELLPSATGFTEVGDINGFGQIVVTEWVRVSISPPGYDHFGYLYTPGLGFQKLEDIATHAQPVRVGSAAGIDENGDIAAEGSIGPDNRAMLLEQRFVSTYGDGCPGTGGLAPRLIAAGTPAPGGRVALLGAAGTRSGAGLMLLSVAPAALPLPGGCTLLVDLSVALAVPVAFNPIGQTHVAFTLPAGVPKVSVYAQLASADPGAPNGAFTLSNGARVDVQ